MSSRRRSIIMKYETLAEEIEQAFIEQDESHLYPINGAIDNTISSQRLK